MSIELTQIRLGLHAFERLTYARKTTVALDAGLLLCEALQTSQRQQLPKAWSDSVWLQICTRASSAWLACLSEPGLQLSVEQVQGLALHRYSLQAMFAGSGFRGNRVLLETLGTMRAGGGFDIPESVALTLAATLGVEWLTDELVRWVVQLPDARMRTAIALGWLAQGNYTSLRAEQICNALLEHPVQYTQDLSAAHNLLLLRVWMGCSYFSSPSKHHLKAAIGAELAHRLPLPKLAKRPNAPRSRPVLLVAAEAINRLHPVFRSYAPVLRQLKDRFHTVLLCQQHLHDEEGRALFHEVIGEMGGGLAETEATLAKVAKLAPDVMFFPAVGMVDWSIALANRRVAPVQVMALGHPATTMSSTMDYVVMPAEYAAAAETFSERVVLMDGDLAHAPAPQLPEPLPRCRHEVDGALRIALNSAYLKLSPLFLDACAEIAHRAKRVVEFHLFPSRHGLYKYALQEQMQRVLPGCVVHESCDYSQHLANLATCHLSLAAFPFGNSNSTVDAFLVGMPVIAIRGTQPHGLTDARKFRPLGLPDWLIAANRKEYVDASLRLIEDDDLRRSISESLSPERVRRAMYGDGNESLKPMDLAGNLEWLLRNHGAIQATEHRVWRNGQPVGGAAVAAG